jgi:heme/copper-type cytochrome/quinol oxidase subunit 2
MTGILFWIAAACCLVAQVALILSAIRAPMTGPTEPASMRMPGRASEIAWTVVPAVALAVLLVFTWREARRTPLPDPHAGHNQVIEE